MRIYTIEDIQIDWHFLDYDDFTVPVNINLISHEKFTSGPGIERVHYVPPSKIATKFRFSKIIFNLLYALQLLQNTKRGTVLLLNGGSELWLYVGLLNRLVMIRRRSIILWDVFVEFKKGWRQKIVRAALSSFRLNVLWSRKQIKSHVMWLNLPAEQFIFIPYKANHSMGQSYNLPIDNYVFAGGNGKRDYATLAEAVHDTGIPIIVSATDPEVRDRIERLPNIIKLAAWEPAFAQLQAGSRFVVVPMVDTGLKGGGEANMCNGMWHGKPVIAMDRMAAEDYIVEGVTGYVVPPGRPDLLRLRIIELWNDPIKCREMGLNARKYADAHFTHEAFIRRLLRLAKLCGHPDR